MPLFALPLAANSSAPQSRVQFSSIPVRNKRKRGASPTPSVSEDNDDAKSVLSRSEAAASTNPLSLTPTEVIQYRLAGLELDEEIPSVKGWPHRGLPDEQTLFSTANVTVDRNGKGKERTNGNEYNKGDLGDRDEDEVTVRMHDEKQREERGPRLRLQHLSVLTAILQRCLLEGDMLRANRAWAMLVRAQVGGKGIDLRGSGYWAVGAELLMRSGEKPRSEKLHGNNDVDSDDEERREENDRELNIKQKTERRWGTAEGLNKTKEYYERLILQHPYKRQFQSNVSALDFWPAMVGCEIYGIQYEQKESLRKIMEKERREDDECAGSQGNSESPVVEEGGDIYAAEERKRARRHQERAEQEWQEREEVRKTALIAYEKLTARLDELMMTPPYSDSHVLLRLRGMLAICIGDLSVPALPINEESGDEDEETIERNKQLGIGGKNTERRFLFRQRLSEHERGKTKQKDEHIRGRKLFERIERESGRKEGVTNSLPGGEEEAEEFFDAES